MIQTRQRNKTQSTQKNQIYHTFYSHSLQSRQLVNVLVRDMGTFSTESSLPIGNILDLVLLAIVTDKLEIALHGQIFTLLVTLLDARRAIVGFKAIERSKCFKKYTIQRQFPQTTHANL